MLSQHHKQWWRNENRWLIQLGVEAIGDETFAETNARIKIENEKGELTIEGGFEDTRKFKPGENINEKDATLDIVNK